jgi:hypothetical protein
MAQREWLEKEDRTIPVRQVWVRISSNRLTTAGRLPRPWPVEP